jgi:lysophospholipase L1-like esterase
MASAGDSITRAFDAGWWRPLSDSPQDSWSTGAANAVDSQYAKVLRAQPAVFGHAYNDARTGATMAALDGQLATAAAQHVQYVTVLMGANDICTSSAATMTATSTFASEFRAALRDFTAADPGAHVFVSSIPNLYQLWSTLHSNVLARLTWSAFDICPSMLGAGRSEAQRQQVKAQEAEDNAALAIVCTTTFAATCRWDNYATYNVDFPARWVSTVDYFHLNAAGERALAATTWAAGYWPSSP